MKKTFLAFISLTTAIFFTSCNLEDSVNDVLGDLLQFNFEINENFTVPVPAQAALVPEGTKFDTPLAVSEEVGPFETRISSLLSENKINTNNIESITAAALKLKTTTNFNAFESIRVSSGNTLIAFIDAIPLDTKEIDLTPTEGENLKDILSNDEVNFKVDLLVREAVKEDINITLESEFTVRGRVNL